MLFRLLLLFTLVPLAEIFLLLLIAEHTSALFTISLVVATGVVGAGLARWQGLSVWFRIHRRLSEGTMPGDELLEGVFILIAAAFLLTPGFLTDTLGFLLLIPPTRMLFVRAVRAWLRRRIDLDRHTTVFYDHL